MKFSKTFKIQASICEIDKVVDLAKFIFDIYKKDRGHFSEPDITVEKSNEEVMTCENIGELENALRRSLISIRGMNFSYWGKSQRIEIRIHKWLKSIEVNVASEKEEDMLRNEMFVNDTFAEKSWNSYSTIVFFLVYFILTVSTLVLFALKQRISVEVVQLSLYGLLIPSFWFENKFSSLYPALILIYNNKKSARILKNDIWFLILTLAIPYLLNRIEYYL